jgi:hypothetical protein
MWEEYSPDILELLGTAVVRFQLKPWSWDE